jgi:glycosyltransferase involved in cell wall biosynthesis
VRVLFLNSRLSDRGGADRWLLGVLARLQGRVETLLAVGYEDRALPRAERSRIGPVVRIKGLDGRGLGRRDGGPVERLRRLIDQFAPHVVHANDVTDPELLEVGAASGRGVQTVQDHRFFCPGRGKVDAADRPCHDPMGESCLRCFEDAAYGERMLDLTRRRLAPLLRMKRITVLSRYMARELAGVGVPPDRIARIPPFVDALAVEPGPRSGAGGGEFHLLASRLTLHKGVEVALAAARALRTALPLVVAGDGPLAGAVEQESRNAGGRVRYAGWADRSRLAALLGRARSVWLPGLWAEPFGIAGLEAMAAGVPVISSAGGGVSDWLADGETGLLVEPGSAADLARAADRLASQPDLARRLGRNGRERAARCFRPEEIMRRLLAVYEGIAGWS